MHDASVGTGRAIKSEIIIGTDGIDLIVAMDQGESAVGTSSRKKLTTLTYVSNGPEVQHSLSYLSNYVTIIALCSSRMNFVTMGRRFA